MRLLGVQLGDVPLRHPGGVRVRGLHPELRGYLRLRYVPVSRSRFMRLHVVFWRLR